MLWSDVLVGVGVKYLGVYTPPCLSLLILPEVWHQLCGKAILTISWMCHILMLHYCNVLMLSTQIEV